MPRGRDLWLPREMRLVSEYLLHAYPRAIHLTRVRLGTWKPKAEALNLTESELRMLGSFRRWADAIAITEDEIVLIEGAIRPDTGEASKLEIYKRLVPHTPELQDWMDRPIRMELVYAVGDAVVIDYCREMGITCVEFRPAWLSEYFERLQRRQRRGMQPRGFEEPGT